MKAIKVALVVPVSGFVGETAGGPGGRGREAGEGVASVSIGVAATAGAVVAPAGTGSLLT